MAFAGTGLEVILSSFSGAAMAQGLKAFWYLFQRKPINFNVLVSTGGMPSSHSAAMTGMATSVGFIEGFTSVAFAIALSVSLVVMYDAAGVRRAAGRMAGILNKLTGELWHNHPENLPTRLKELLGHTPLEVFAGAVLGIALAYWIHFRLADAPFL